MKRLGTLLGFLLQLVGCGEHHEVVQDAELKPYLDRFVQSAQEIGGQDLSAQASELSLKLTPLSTGNKIESIQGQCVNTDGVMKVEINPDVWPNLNENDREKLLYHEFGHCLLGRGHVGGTNVAIPDMNSVMVRDVDLIDSANYAKYKAYYLNEMFVHPLADKYAKDTDVQPW